jgi:hypothetical protein
LHPSLSESFLAGLAPSPLAYRRQNRSRGDERAVTLADLGPEAGDTLRQLYLALGSLEARPAADAPAPTDAQGSAPFRAHSATLLDLVGRLARNKTARPHVNEVLHDVRSGALTALVFALDRAAARARSPDDAARHVALLARDHRKLMRAAIADLDLERRQHDRKYRLHGVARLLDPVRALPPAGTGAVTLDCRFTGALTTCCTELGTIERVFYNLLNNASRHGAGGGIGLWLLPEPADDPHDLRVVVANFIAEEQRGPLTARFGAAPWPPADRGPATGGLGLRICAELVSNAYGLAALAECIGGGYVGARVSGDTFVAWFHWPVVRHGGALEALRRWPGAGAGAKVHDAARRRAYTDS